MLNNLIYYYIRNILDHFGFLPALLLLLSLRTLWENHMIKEVIISLIIMSKLQSVKRKQLKNKTIRLSHTKNGIDGTFKT